ncbi:1-phosphofructokinase [Natronosporangium hydrolyticum]|uniref:1-phosphofructokinase n=1 Tax=Natronosporangium hydrolyticum TaxID=2811111 RepID=A0A895YFB2_9ACTN|nr:1-phosphofructokinase [Natronosporangium hydrolyticum]QSB13226.1 1-phosphofructokinase [Natronosporangium hydrolyticum]
MILTLTLNPSLDRTVEIGELERGEVIRAARNRVDPGGKGVNVSRALLANGHASRAVLPCGGDEGQHLVRLLHDEGVDLLAVPIAGHTRSNISLVEPDGTVTKINETGPELSPAEFVAVTNELLAAAAGADWVVACGSLPPGLPQAAFPHLCRSLVDGGVRVAVDTSGPGLRAAADAGVALVKPNREELAEVVGAALPTIPDVVAAAQQLRSWGAGAVLASLGADGAILIDDDGITRGDAPVPRPRSAVGAGDALLAGFLAAGARGPDALAEALAWGAAAVSLPGSRMPGPADLRREQVRLSPPARPAATPPPPV